MKITTLKQAKQITGHASGLGRPSKMPGYSTALSALNCQVGSALRNVAGSSCASCYAMRGKYGTPSVKLGHARRLAALENPGWVDGMIYLINRGCAP